MAPGRPALKTLAPLFEESGQLSPAQLALAMLVGLDLVMSLQQVAQRLDHAGDVSVVAIYLPGRVEGGGGSAFKADKTCPF